MLVKVDRLVNIENLKLFIVEPLGGIRESNEIFIVVRFTVKLHYRR